MGTIPYEPNLFWHRVLTDQHQAVIVAGPRDIGKTAGCVAWIGVQGFDRPGVIGAYVSLTHDHVIETLVPEVMKQYPGAWHSIKKGREVLLLPGGCEIWLFSATEKSRVNRIKGIKRPDFWIWDEAAFFYPGIMAMCFPNYRVESRQFYCSSKYPDTEFQNLVEKVAIDDPAHFIVYEPHGEDEERPPHLTVEQWRTKRAQQRAMFPAAVAERELDNRWGSAEGAVFRHVDEAVERGRQRWQSIPPEGMKVAMVLDIAKEQDFTWLAVVGKHNELTFDHLGNPTAQGGWVIWFLDRFQQIEYDEQERRVARGMAPYGSRCAGGWVDKGNVGARVIPELRKLLTFDIHPVDYGSGGGANHATMKDRMVYDLALALDRGQADIAPTALAEPGAIEWRRYAYIHSTTPGRVKYGAPPGYHDDAVSCGLQATVAVGRIDDTPFSLPNIEPGIVQTHSLPRKKSFYTHH